MLKKHSKTRYSFYAEKGEKCSLFYILIPDIENVKNDFLK